MVNAVVEQQLTISVSYLRLFTSLSFPKDQILDGNRLIGSGIVPNAPAEWSEKSHIHIVLQPLKEPVQKQVHYIKGEMETQSQDEAKNFLEIALFVPEKLFSQLIRKYETRSLGNLAFILTVTVPNADVDPAGNPYSTWLQSKKQADKMPVVVKSFKITGPEYVMID